MKVAARDINSFLSSPPKTIYGCLFYGADEGKTHEYAEKIKKNLQGDSFDEMNFIEFSASEIKENPSIFLSEAAMIPMFGGQKIIKIRDGKDALTKSLSQYLENPHSEVFILIEAQNLEAKSSLRKLFEKENNLAAIPCYLDEQRDISQLIHEIIKYYQLKIDPDAYQLLTQRLGRDRAISRMEIEKLCLYKGEGSINFKDVSLLMGDNGLSNIQFVIDAALLGELRNLEQNMNRLWAENIEPIALLRMTLFYLLKLQQVLYWSQNGISIEEAMKKLTPKLFFKQESIFKRQAKLWDIKALTSMINRLSEWEQDLMTYPNLAQTFIYRNFMMIAVSARKKIKS